MDGLAIMAPKHANPSQEETEACYNIPEKLLRFCAVRNRALIIHLTSTVRAMQTRATPQALLVT